MVAPRGYKKNSGPPWNNRGKLKGGGGAVGRWACSRTSTGRDRKYGWVTGMLGRRRAMPRWSNDIVWQSDMLGRRHGTPRWSDEPVWCLWRRLGDMEWLGSIHNNTQQNL